MAWYRTRIRNKKTGTIRNPFGPDGIISEEPPGRPPGFDRDNDELVTEDVTEEIEARLVVQKRAAEYPTFYEWKEAEHAARVDGDAKKLEEMDLKVAAVNAKYPEKAKPVRFAAALKTAFVSTPNGSYVLVREVVAVALGLVVAAAAYFYFTG